MTSSLHASSGLHRGPCHCKGAQHRSRRESGPSSVCFGVSKASQALTYTDPLPPSAHPAHLQSRLFRSFGQRSGARATGETLKLSRVAVEAREPVSFTSLRLSFPDSQAVRLRETHPKNVARGVQRSEAIGENCLAALLQANAITVIYPLGSASWSLLR